MLYSHLFNAKDIDPAAFAGDALESACAQLAKLQKRGRPRWTVDEVKSKLVEIAVEGWEQEPPEVAIRFLANGSASYCSDEAEWVRDRPTLPECILKLAEQECIACYMLHGHTLVQKVMPDTRDHDANTLVFNYWAGRVYCYNGASAKLAVRQMTVRGVQQIPQISIKKEAKKEKKHFECPLPVRLTGEDDPAELPPGEYMTRIHWHRFEEDWGLQSIRYYLVSRGISPAQSVVPSEAGIRYIKLWYPHPSGKGNVVFRSVQDHWEESRKFAELFSEKHGELPYRLQTQGVLMDEALRILIKPKRAWLSEAKRAEMAREQKTCAECNSPLGANFEVDHEQPLASGGSNDPENLRCLCLVCHGSKSVLESLGRLEQDQLTSEFSPDVYERFVKSPKPRQMYINARKFEGPAPRCMADVAKCRFSALYENVYPIPVYSPVDTIEPFNGELADYMWVDKGVPQAHRAATRSQSYRNKADESDQQKVDHSNMFACLPYQGPRWYFRPLVEFMLDRKIIGLKHILWSLQATTHLKPDFFRAPFDELKRLWQLAGSEASAKFAFNSLFGVWAMYDPGKYKVLSTDRLDDVLPYGEWCERKFITDTNFWLRQPILQRYMPEMDPEEPSQYHHFQDYIFKTEQLKTTSMRPIHQMCLDMEQLRLAQAICVARRVCESRQLCATRVDALFFQPARCQLENIKKKFESLTYADLHTVHMPPQPRGQKRLAELQLQPNPSNAKVFKFETVSDEMAKKQSLVSGGKKADYAVPVVEGELSVNPEMPWIEHPEEKAMELVLSNNSIFIEGLAGTGKSTLTKEFVKALEERGDRVMCCAFTHVAAKNIGGCTLHHFAHKYIFHGSYTGWLIVDEVGQLTLPLIAALNRLLLNEQAGQPVRFILLGDFRGQLLAIKNSWRGQLVEDKDYLRNSALFKRLAGHNKVTLTACRRSDDPDLFKFYASLPDREERGEDVKDAVVEAAQLCARKKGLAKWNLSLTNRKRKEICKQVNDAEAREAASQGKTVVPVQAHTEDGQSQDMLVFEGLTLVGCNLKRRGVFNGCFYTVLEVDEEQTKLQNEDAKKCAKAPQEAQEDAHENAQEAESEELSSHAPSESDSDTTDTSATVMLPTAELSTCLRLAHCMTYAACQSRTLRGRLRLHEVRHPRFTHRHLNVGLSRGTSCQLIDLCQ